jgi:hypothetical protein
LETVGELGHAPRPGFNETSDEALSRGVTFASRYITSMYYVLLQEMAGTDIEMTCATIFYILLLVVEARGVLVLAEPPHPPHPLSPGLALKLPSPRRGPSAA